MNIYHSKIIFQIKLGIKIQLHLAKRLQTFNFLCLNHNNYIKIIVARNDKINELINHNYIRRGFIKYINSIILIKDR